jgi:hypothetical protein
MFQTKRAAGALSVVAGVALIGFTGSVASAGEVMPNLVSADKPVSPGGNGNGAENGDKVQECTQDQNCDPTETPDQTRDRDQVKDQTQDQDQIQDQVRDQTKDQTRAALREEIRLNGGSWGAYQRQGSLMKVATTLAERYGATPENTNADSLGRVLTLFNSGLPSALQIDVEMFLAQYELSLSDITWPDGT